MSTSELSYQTVFANTNALTNTIATNLYLYGSQNTPLNLNDRLRPVVASERKFADNEGRTANPNQFDIQVNLYNSTFFTAAGPGRFDDLSKYEFLRAYFDDNNWQSEFISGVGVRTFLRVGLIKI